MTSSDAATPSAGRPSLPQFHIRPGQGWLNDPNGIVRRNGRWHVFFQHNPDEPVHSDIAWGHVSSEDLATWTEHDVAFTPEEGAPDAFGCWSGVAVTGLDRPAVAYSGVIGADEQSTICLRWGSDDLMTWSDPVVVGTTPTDAGVDVMRDPFIFEFGGHRWALLGASLAGGVPGVLLYACDDILDWTFVEVWCTPADPVLASAGPADIWECPQLVWADGTPVLVLSPQLHREFLDVIAVVGRVEEVDGRPRFTGLSVDRIDLGGSLFYAPQAVQESDRPLLFGWVRQGNQDVFQGGSPVAGCLTLPRRLSVQDGQVRVSADEAVSLLVGAEAGRVEAGEHPLGDAVLLEVDSVGEGSPWELHGAQTVLSAPLPTGTRIWVDADVVEVYPGDGNAPTTLRRQSGSWRLVVPTGASATLREVAPGLSEEVPPTRG